MRNCREEGSHVRQVLQPRAKVLHTHTLPFINSLVREETDQATADTCKSRKGLPFLCRVVLTPNSATHCKPLPQADLPDTGVHVPARQRLAADRGVPAGMCREYGCCDSNVRV